MGLQAIIDSAQRLNTAARRSKDVNRDTSRDLSGMAGELAALKADAYHWLTSSEYAALRHRLEDAHAAVEAALVEARRRARLSEERDKPQGL